MKKISESLSAKLWFYYSIVILLLSAVVVYYFTNKQHLWSWKGKINSRERPRWMSDMAMDKLHQTNVELGLIY